MSNNKIEFTIYELNLLLKLIKEYTPVGDRYSGINCIDVNILLHDKESIRNKLLEMLKSK